MKRLEVYLSAEQRAQLEAIVKHFKAPSMNQMIIAMIDDWYKIMLQETIPVKIIPVQRDLADEVENRREYKEFAEEVKAAKEEMSW